MTIRAPLAARALGNPWLFLVGAAVAAGVALRVWTFTLPVGGLDADEAVWGLMARHADDGELTAFFWDQAYGGTAEAALTAPLFWLFGSGVVQLRIVPIALFAVSALLIWRVGKRTVGEPAASLAGALFWIWPSYVVWKSTRAHGFYASSVLLAVTLMLLALRLRERDSWLDMGLLGLVAGLGWWVNPQFVFVGMPTLAWLFIRRPELLRPAWLAAVTALLGAGPWLVWNLTHGWASLESPVEPGGGDSYVDHVRTFFYATLPQGLGLRVPFSLEWITGPLVGRTLEVLALLAVAYVVARRRRRRELLLVIALAYPVLQSFSPLAAFNEEPRYLFLLAPVIALLLAEVLARHVLLATAGTVAAVLLSVVGLQEMGHHRLPVPPVGRERTPADLAPALRALERAGATRVRAHFSIAYRIDFESEERIIADSTSQVRYEPYHRLLLRTPHPAYVFVADSDQDRRATALVRNGYRRMVAGDWAVYLWSRAP